MALISLPAFPKSLSEKFIHTSEQTPHYNCIAWAYGDNTKWYWPDSAYYWPSDIPMEVTQMSFMMLFNRIGYEVCMNGDLELGYEKVAVYINNLGKPTHAARQLESGLWTSKLGNSIDVSHTILGMSDGFYGNVGFYMKRKLIPKTNSF